MKKHIKYTSLIFAGAVLMSSGVAYAEINANISNTTTIDTQPLKANTGVKADTKDKMGLSAETRNEIKDTRTVIYDTITASQKEFKKNMNTKTAEAGAKITAQRAEAKKNLAKIKDEKKRETVEKINAKFQDLNVKATNHFSASISRIENVLVNIETRINSSGAAGAEVSALTANNALALKAIADAKASIVIQSGKTYAVNVVNEKTLRAEAQKAREALNKDLRAVNEKVKTAYDAVKSSVVLLAKIPNINANMQTTTKVETGTNANSTY